MAQTGFSVTIRKNDFHRIAANMPRRTSTIVRKTAFDVIALSAPNTPVETGFLRGSAGIRTEGEFRAVVFWAAFYAAFQEFGTRHIPPQLFATRAAELVRPQFIEAMRAMIRELV